MFTCTEGEEDYMQRKKINVEVCHYISPKQLLIFNIKDTFNSKNYLHRISFGDWISVIGIMSEWKLDKMNNQVAHWR